MAQTIKTSPENALQIVTQVANQFSGKPYDLTTIVSGQQNRHAKITKSSILLEFDGIHAIKIIANDSALDKIPIWEVHVYPENSPNFHKNPSITFDKKDCVIDWVDEFERHVTYILRNL